MNKFYRSFYFFLLCSALTFPQTGWYRQYSGTTNDLTNTFFTDSLHGVVVGNGGVILKTSDGGEHWYQKDGGTSNNLTFVSFVNEQVGTIVGDGGLILRTEDGGDIWIQQKSGVIVTLTAVSFYDENNGVAVGGNTIIRTTDGGQNWEIISTGVLLDVLYRVHYFDYNNIIVICYYIGPLTSAIVYKSTDAGISWPQTAALGYGASHVFADSKFIDDNTGFILEWHGQSSSYYSHIHKTTDGGVNWKEISSSNSWIPPTYSLSFIDANFGFIVGRNGNIYKTTNGGVNWTVQLTQSKGSVLRSVVFTDQNNGFIVGDGGSIYRTKTGGINSSTTKWLLSGRSNSSDFMSVQLVNQKVCYCVGNARNDSYSRYDWQSMTNCVMKTMDGGINWMNNNLWPITPYDIWMNEDGLGSIVGIRTGGYPAPNGRMYNTYDGGKNWQEYLFDESLNEMSYRIARGIYYLDHSRRIIIAQYGRILYTLDGGVTWTKSDSVTAWDLNDLSFGDDKVGYVVGDRGTILKTTDSGISWSLIPMNTGDNLYGVYFTDANNGTVVGMYGKILKTTDGGISWIEQQSGTYNHLYKIVFDKNNGMIAGEFGTILNSNDGGETWTREESGTSINLNDVSIKDSTTIAVGDFGTILVKGVRKDTTTISSSWKNQHLESNTTLRSISSNKSGNFTSVGYEGIWRTTDGGVTWHQKLQSDYDRLYDIWFSDSNNGMAVGYGSLLKTTNSGESWFYSELSGEVNFMKWRNANGVFMIDSMHQIVVGDIGTIIHTSNWGSNWTKINSGTAENLNDVYFVNSKVGFIVGNNGEILRTESSGKSWYPIFANIKKIFNGVYFFDLNNGFIVGTDGTVLKTTDSGFNWQLQDIGIFNNLFGICFSSESNGLIVGEFGTILRTTDSGKTWGKEVSNTSSDLYGVSIRDSIGIIVGKNGTVLRKMDPTFIDSTETDSTLKIPSEYYLSQNYPNPFNPSTNIKYSILRQSFVTLKIYDLLGREAATLVNEEKPTGIYEIEFDGSNLSSGVYFYRLKTNEYAKTKKMILLR